MSVFEQLRARWHYWLGLAQRSRGNRSNSLEAYHDSIAEFTQAIERHPNFALAHYARGVVYWRELSDYERAIRDFTRALELNPRIVQAYLNRGLSRVYGQLGTRDEILADFERYLDLGKDSYWRIEAYNQIARLKNSRAPDRANLKPKS